MVNLSADNEMLPRFMTPFTRFLPRRIALVIPPTFREFVTNFLDSQKTYRDVSKVILVDGAETRHRSIWNGVEALRKLSRDDSNRIRVETNGSCNGSESLSPRKFDDLVVIHDAARPFLDASTLDAVIDAAWNYGAAGVVRPLVSTVVRPDEHGFLQETLVRADYRASEMPQVNML